MAGAQAFQFRIDESRDADGALRLTLLRELDLTVAPRLDARLAELRETSAQVRLDLSKLEFIDSSGIRVVTLAALDARRNGWWIAPASRSGPRSTSP
jgi:anti-anti-sigma factor